MRKEKGSFQSICSILHFHQQCGKGSVASTCLLTIGQVNFLASLVSVKWSTLTVFYFWKKNPSLAWFQVYLIDNYPSPHVSCVPLELDFPCALNHPCSPDSVMAEDWGGGVRNEEGGRRGERQKHRNGDRFKKTEKGRAAERWNETREIVKQRE